MVSANAFWRGNRFVVTPELFNGLDVALDSAGFVAMSRYWGYRWNLDQYVDLAGTLKPTWWAAPDYCCEPEIATNREEIGDRIARTAFKLDWTRQVAADRGVTAPLPVLQGWLPEDYVRCADMIGELPSIVGIGSMCRRRLGGAVGVLRIVTTLVRERPHVKFHLFGVKGTAVAALTGHPAIHSIDSMAWDYAARRQMKRDGENFNMAYRIGHMRRWYRTQQDALGLFHAGPGNP